MINSQKYNVLYFECDDKKTRPSSILNKLVDDKGKPLFHPEIFLNRAHGHPYGMEALQGYHVEGLQSDAAVKYAPIFNNTQIVLAGCNTGLKRENMKEYCENNGCSAEDQPSINLTDACAKGIGKYAQSIEGPTGFSETMHDFDSDGNYLGPEYLVGKTEDGIDTMTKPHQRYQRVGTEWTPESANK